MKISSWAAAILLAWFGSAACGAEKSDVIDVTGLRELFIDDHLGAERRNLEFKGHEPMELAADAGKPCGHYSAILKVNDKYRFYYRGFDGVYPGKQSNGNPGEYLAVRESSDGVTWQEVPLNKFPGKPVPAGTIFYGNGFTHNFSPFYDRNPDCPPAERFKAVSGVRETGGLFAFYSADGINWHHYDEKNPIFKYEPKKFGGHMLD